MRIGIGLSEDPDCGKAGADAVRRAKETVPEPQLALIYAAFDRDHEKILAGACREADPRVVMGGSSYAEVTNAGVTKNSVIALLLAFDDASVRLAGVDNGPEPYRNGLNLAEAFGGWKPGPDRVPAGVMITHFAAGFENEMLKGLKERLGPVPLFGGMGCGGYDKGSAHEDFFKSYQYAGSALKKQAARMALFDLPKDDYRVGFGFEHGWQPVGPEVELTRCDVNNVYEVGGMPIVDFFRQFISREESEEFFEKDFQRYAFSLLMEEAGSTRSIIKVPVAVDFDKGFVTFFPAEDLQGRRIRMILGSRRSAVQGARKAAENCKASLDGLDPALLLVVSCCTRNAILHSRMNSEVDAVREVFGMDVPIFGFYSGGEIVPFKSRYEDIVDPKQAFSGSHYHATTIGIMAIGAKRPAAPVGVPSPCVSAQEPEAEAARLRKLLEASEQILDNTESFMANLSRKSYQDGEQIRKQNEIIHRYTPHDVWKQIGDNVARGEYELHDAEFKGCFLFMDVKGFTSYSEEHGSNAVVCALNEIFKPATEAIYGCGGDVDKYIGDCIFAAFRDPDAALDAGAHLLRLFSGLKEKGSPFSVRIGINGGRAVRANVGGEDRREYTFIGDAVNTAQRLESNCTPGRLLISEALYKRGKDRFSGATRREITVKGKKKPLTVYECDARPITE